MLEARQSVVGMIEIDTPVEWGAQAFQPSPYAARRLAGHSKQLSRITMAPAEVCVERVTADLPRLSRELRVELDRFLSRLREDG